MSIDYWSFCAALPRGEAAEAIEALAPLQNCGTLVGPDEETIVPSWRGSKALDVNRIALAFDERRPDASFWESAAVPLPEDWLERLPEGLVMTNRSSALSGLDRVLALPQGVAVLSGHAIAHVPNGELARFTKALNALWKSLGGKAAAAQTLQEYLYGNANEGAAEAVIELLTSAVATATKKRLDVLLVSATPP